jgi:hypothetical protein
MSKLDNSRNNQRQMVGRERPTYHPMKHKDQLMLTHFEFRDLGWTWTLIRDLTSRLMNQRSRTASSPIHRLTCTTTVPLIALQTSIIWLLSTLPSNLRSLTLPTSPLWDLTMGLCLTICRTLPTKLTPICLMIRFFNMPNRLIWKISFWNRSFLNNLSLCRDKGQ